MKLTSAVSSAKTFKDPSGNSYSESDFSLDELFDEKGRRRNPITGEVIVETTAEEKPSEETAPVVAAEPVVATTADNSPEPEQKEESIEEKIQAAVSKLGNALDAIPIEKGRDEVKAYIDGLGANFANELSNIVMAYYDATVAKAKAEEQANPNNADMIQNINQLLAGTGIQINNADELNQFVATAANNAKNAYYQSILFSNQDIMNAYNSLMAQQQAAV